MTGGSGFRRLGDLARAWARRVLLCGFGLVCGLAFFSTAVGAPPARIKLAAHNESVRDVLLRLSNLAHMNITVADDVHGQVNLALNNATPNEALDAICTQLRLRCVNQNGTVLVSVRNAAVVPLSLVSASRAAKVVRQLFPRLGVQEGAGNTLVLFGSDADIQSARAVVQGLDVRDPTKPATEAVTLHTLPASIVAEQLRALYPSARITAVGKSTMLISATPADLNQIKTAVAGIDAGATPAPTQPPVASDAVRVSQRRPQDVARAVSSQVPHVRVAVSGPTVTLRGSPEDVARARTLIAQLDVPPYGTKLTQIYRLRNVDAGSVANLIRRAFPAVEIAIDASLNAISVTATAADQARIADGIAQLDGTFTSGASRNPDEGGSSSGLPSTSQIVQLRSIIPGYQGSTTTAQDLANSVQQALSVSHPELRIIAPNGMQTLIVTGSAQAVRDARTLIDGLDIVPQSVALDTEILELDENSLSNLGLQLGTTSIGTTFSEVTPPFTDTGQPGRIIGLQAITRTPFSFQAQINLLVQSGRARVLEDPRITTLSGRTATIRSGDTISILTSIGGGTGTVATTQLESFQTGVTLDITPIITNAGELSVALHPIVNSLTGFINGVPQISTRDTQTTVHLHDNETLVISGLIEENTQHTYSKIPLLGDLPLLGGLFRNENTTATRNELIIVVTPHIISPDAVAPNRMLPPGMAVPTPAPLPTLPPDATFPGGVPTPAPLRPRPAASPAPGAALVTPAPSPTPAVPSAFAQANKFVYGSPPPSNYAAPGDTPQIFYVTLTPSVLTPGATVHVNAITTTNVQRLTLGTGTATVGLSPTGLGTWQGVFSANVLGLSPTATQARLLMTASRSDGQSVSIPIGLSMLRSSAPDVL